MWFNKDKSEAQEDKTPRTRKRNSDMRSELGLGSDADSERSARPTARRAATQSQTPANNRAVYNEDVQLNDLKVRARRRLIGALVLLGGAFVILPWVFDDDRKLTAPAVTVSVPDKKLEFEVQNPKAPTTSNNTAGTDNLKPVEDKKPEDNLVATTKTVEPAAEKPAEPTTKYVVHIGIVTDAGQLTALINKLSAAGVKASQEKITVNGVKKTRVRLGPFDSQADAQNAADKAKGAAKNPIVIPLK